MRKDLEIGVIYTSRTSNVFWLAVDKNKLITIENQKTVREINPRSRYVPKREVTIQDILNEWKIPIETLDNITELYLRSNLVISSSRRGPRDKINQNKDEEESYMHIRLHRLPSDFRHI